MIKFWNSRKRKRCLHYLLTYVALFIICGVVILYLSDSSKSYSVHLSQSCNCHSESHSESFSSAMSKFNWMDFGIAVNSSSEQGLAKATEYYETVCAKLVEFVKKPIPVPINLTCGPPPLQISAGFQCNSLQKPRKVGILLHFGFEVDALEIYLHELDAVVDKFFICESPVAHNPYLGIARKPLVWESLRYDPRFAQFKSKVVHFVVDDATTATGDKGEVHQEWRVEYLQDGFRWIKFLEWNSRTNYFSSDDVLGFGHTDEIPHRDNVYTLKHCELPSDYLDIAIWFPCPYLDTAFAADDHIRDHPYTHGNPAFWRLGYATRFFNWTGRPPNRMYGKSPYYFLGGMHMSAYLFPPFRMLKRFSSTHVSRKDMNEMIELGRLYGLNETRKATERIYTHSFECTGRTKNISELAKIKAHEMDAVAKLPWFIQCNPGRYPCLRENGYDLRLL